jgi:ribosomal protein L27
MGRDHTIFAVQEGQVNFQARGSGKVYISVVGPESAEA